METRDLDRQFDALIGRSQTTQNPFVAFLLDRDHQVIAEGFDRHRESPILHCETDAIHQAALGKPGFDFSQATLLTTAEPCPMCQAAIIWAGIPKVYFGVSRPFLVDLGIDGFHMRAEALNQDAKHYQGSLQQSHAQACEKLFKTSTL